MIAAVPALGAAIGAGIGALIDAAIPGRQRLYSVPAVTVRPQFTATSKQIAVALRWGQR